MEMTLLQLLLLLLLLLFIASADTTGFIEENSNVEPGCYTRERILSILG
jgi:soluble P-type ATPase